MINIRSFALLILTVTVLTSCVGKKVKIEQCKTLHAGGKLYITKPIKHILRIDLEKNYGKGACEDKGFLKVIHPMLGTTVFSLKTTQHSNILRFQDKTYILKGAKYSLARHIGIDIPWKHVLSWLKGDPQGAKYKKYNSHGQLESFRTDKLYVKYSYEAYEQLPKKVEISGNNINLKITIEQWTRK